MNPITLFDVVRDKIGEKDTYTGQDFEDVGVPMFGGCETCGESLGVYNAYPSKSGYIRCHVHVGPNGFETCEEFWKWDEEEG